VDLAVEGRLGYVCLISGELGSYTLISMMIIVLTADNNAGVDLRFAVEFDSYL
jgi:hypothetical protein